MSEINTAKLRGIRAERYLSMRETAEKLGITPKSYENKEKGVTEFTRAEILKLIDIFNH